MEINRTSQRLSAASLVGQAPGSDALRLWVHAHDPAFVFRMRFLFEQSTEIQLVRRVQTLGELEEAITAARRHADVPALLLVDAGCHHSGAATLVRDCVHLLNGVPVLALTSNASSSMHALCDGAAGALCRDAPVDLLLEAVHAARHGRLFLPEAETEVVLEHLRERAHTLPCYGLTQREHQVLEGLSRGLSQKDIARAHFVSQATINTHVQRLYAKLGVQSAAAAVGKGLREGLI